MSFRSDVCFLPMKVSRLNSFELKALFRPFHLSLDSLSVSGWHMAEQDRVGRKRIA